MTAQPHLAHMSADLDRTRENFVETIGVFFQTEGMPRTAGRLLGLLIFDGDAVSFSDLAERLQVSRGSISTASRLLVGAGIVQRVSKPGERQDYFQLADKPYEALVSTELGRLAYAQAEIAKTMRAVPAERAGTCARLGAFCDFFKAMETGLKGILPGLSGNSK